MNCFMFCLFVPTAGGAPKRFYMEPQQPLAPPSSAALDFLSDVYYDMTGAEIS